MTLEAGFDIHRRIRWNSPVYNNPGTGGEEDERIIRGFRLVSVFDVAQTGGEELPTVCSRLDGDDTIGAHDILFAVARSIGFTVVPHEFDGTTNGDCSHSEHRIRIEIRNPPAQQVKTLAHDPLMHCFTRSSSLGHLPSLRLSPWHTWSASRSGSTPATTPSDTSNLGRWWRTGHCRNQDILQAHPARRGNHPSSPQPRRRRRRKPPKTGLRIL